MSRIGRSTLFLAATALETVAVSAQPLPRRAPVPRQVVAARTAFIGNGGSESYGAESYFRLTRYDGGPDRAYTTFYSVVERWGHYDLVGSTGDADILLVIKFRNPIVDREHAEAASDQPHDWVYDPQLDLSINDPRTGLTLWSITEHIEPGRDRAADNRHFDEAITRLVDDLRTLILNPETTAALDRVAPPPGAIAAAQRRTREQHATIGLLLGSALGGVLAAKSVNDSCNDLNDLQGCARRGGAKMRNEILGTIGGAVVGALVGWVLPVTF